MSMIVKPPWYRHDGCGFWYPDITIYGYDNTLTITVQLWWVFNIPILRCINMTILMKPPQYIILSLISRYYDSIPPSTRVIDWSILQVRENFGIVGDGSSTHGGATVACFLVQEGANMYVQNQKGHTPLQLCSPDIAALVTTFAGRKGWVHGINSLVPRPLPAVRLSRRGPGI